jgi:antitoxin MazE
LTQFDDVITVITVKMIELQITPIGNSRGIRIPASILKKYGITDTVLLEERRDEIVLRTRRSKKLSWKETFAEMANAKEDWSDLDAATPDGIDEH